MRTTRTSWRWGSRGRTHRSGGGYGGSSHHYYGAGSSVTRDWTPSWSYNPSQFSKPRQEIECRIWSYRMLNQQFSGSGKVTAFSPTTATRWVKFVNDGAYVYKFANKDFCRWFGNYWTGSSPNAAYKYLRKRFGSGIKAVARGRGNAWLVCAMPTVSARPFSNYNWK